MSSLCSVWTVLLGVLELWFDDQSEESVRSKRVYKKKQKFIVFQDTFVLYAHVQINASLYSSVKTANKRRMNIFLFSIILCRNQNVLLVWVWTQIKLRSLWCLKYACTSAAELSISLHKLLLINWMFSIWMSCYE